MTRRSVPEVCVVVPTYRRPRLLAACLDSLREQSASYDDFEVVVVDDGSGDTTPEVLRRTAEAMPTLRWESATANAGPAAARNRAVAMTDAPLLLFLDDDIVASPSLVATHLALQRGRPENYGVVGLVEWLPALTVTPFMRWLDRSHLQFRFDEMADGAVVHPADALYTCNLSMTRAIFEAAGRFDERFPYPAFEDLELGIRLAAAGFELNHHRDALAWHARAVTLAEFRARMVKAGESAVLLEQSHPELDVSIDDSAGSQRWPMTRVGLRALSAVTPRLLGRDIRAATYQAEVAHAYRTGLRRGRRVPR